MALNERKKCFNDDLEILEKSIEGIHETLIEMKSAFPNGDLDGHRRAHEAMIKAAEAQERFWQDVKLDFVKKGVWAGLVLVLSLIAIGIYYKASILFVTPPK